MGFLAMILGPLMRMLYQMIPNFAVTMIVFTVIIKLLMLPLMIKQQKSMAKMSVFTPMINEIQQKYKNNQEKMQEEMGKLQEELDVREYTAAAGGGAVTAVVDGKHIVKKLEIKPEVVDPEDVDMLADLVMAAVNEAIRQAVDTSEAEMSKITGGINMPGLF